MGTWQIFAVWNLRLETIAVVFFGDLVSEEVHKQPMQGLSSVFRYAAAGFMYKHSSEMTAFPCARWLYFGLFGHVSISVSTCALHCMSH